MRVLGWMCAVAVVAGSGAPGWAQPAEPPAQLVRDVVYNELHDHERHAYWRYWIAQRSEREMRLSEQVETTDGPVVRLVAVGGLPLAGPAEEQETARLQRLLGSAQEQARHRQEYAEDERRIGRIVALLPDAFLYDYAGEEGGCIRLRFRPNPGYPARGVEARIFHAMQGELWVDTRQKRLARLSGELEENVDFGYGLLGRLFKGGCFRMERRQVSATDWKTERLEIHMSGRALLFKTIARETSETRGGFAVVPAGLTLAQGVALLGAQPTQSAMVAPAKAIGASAFALKR